MRIASRVLAPLAALSFVAAPAAADEPFTFVALGDMPYAVPEDYARFERLIEAVNELAPAFTIHVGDTKSGSTVCSDAMLQATLDRLNLFEQPLIYTPGDNEWTDCHRERAGGYDPLERLARVREMHFQTAQSLGRQPMPLIRQSDGGDHPQMVENARWVYNDVLFATIHVVGSNNGFERTLESVAEYFARNAANLAWIGEAFAEAERQDHAAVVIAFQANLRFGAFFRRNSGFGDTIAALAEGAEAFAKPVLLVQGDDHVLLIDQPLTDSQGATLETVYRLQVMGANMVQAVRVGVDPSDPAVFSFQPLIVPENLNRGSM